MHHSIQCKLTSVGARVCARAGEGGLVDQLNYIYEVK